MSTCPQLAIGLVAYGVTPQHVMVRVPNERGRWVLTDRSVAEVPCSQCGSVKGEPCANRRGGGVRYWAGTHWTRRQDAGTARGRGRPNAAFPRHKLRVTAEELAEAQQEPPPDTCAHDWVTDGLTRESVCTRCGVQVPF